MASSREGEYEVVHEYVNVRSAPSTKGRLLATLPRGARLRAAPFRVGGEPWLRLDVASLPAATAERLEGEDAAWALADASETPLGLGELLRRAEEPVTSSGAREIDGGRVIRVHCLSGAVHEVLVDCLWDERDLKAAVGRAAGMPSEEVRLLRGTEELSGEAMRALLWDGAELEDLTVVRDSTHMHRPLQLDDWVSKVRKDWRCLKEAPEFVRADPHVVRLAVQQDWTALLHASVELRSNRGVALDAVGAHWKAFEHVDPALRGDPQLALAAARQSAAALRWADDCVFGDRKVLMAAVRQQPELLERATEELRLDRSVVLAAVKLEGAAIRFAAERLLADWQVVRTAVESDGLALRHACEVLRGDRHIVLTAARQNPYALAHATPDAFEHPDVALAAAAVKQCPDVLKDTAEDLYTLHKVRGAAGRPAAGRGGVGQQQAVRPHPPGHAAQLSAVRNVVLAAVSQDGMLLRFAHANLCHEREVVLAAVSQKGLALQFAPECLREDEEIVLTAVQEDFEALQYASKDLMAERSIVVAATGQCLEALKFLPDSVVRHFWIDPSVWGDPEVVLDLVAQDGRLLRYASPEVARDREVVLAAVEQNWEAYRHATLEIREDREIALAIVAQDAWALAHVPEKFRADRKVVLAAVRAHGCALEHATPWLQRNREVVLQAVRQDARALCFASKDLQADKEVIAAAGAAARESAAGSLEASIQPGDGHTEEEAAHRGDAELPALADPGRGRLGSLRMRDPEGEEGIYTGPLDAQGQADGEGEFVYEDGERFVGHFSAGAMRKGVLYSQRTSRPRDTMREGEWTPKIDEAIVRAFPVHRASCQATLKAAEEAARKAVQERNAAKEGEALKKAAERAARVRKALEKRPLHRALRGWRKAVAEKPLIDAFAEWKAAAQWRARRRLDASWKRQFLDSSWKPQALAHPLQQAHLAQKPEPQDSRRLWSVVGGEGKGGILARELESTASPTLHERLATGATVEELELRGNRLRFRRVAGEGPELGWVSITLEGRPLVKRLSKEV